MEEHAKIPVTIITGFLGAGKTTLINNILQQYNATKFALVENEFGEVAIDTQLISGVDASGMFELKQGCICCSINDEYELVLNELLDHFPDVEHLLIETTGIADPLPVIRPFLSTPDLQRQYRYNGTICLVDAQGYENLAEKEITSKQLAVADRILVNKSEGLTPDAQEYLQNELQKYSPFAKIESTNFAQISDDILNALNTIQHSFLRLENEKSAHAHIQTKTVAFTYALPRESFLRWLEYTLDIYRHKIYRAKGILVFQNEPFEYILQGVGGRFELVEGDLIMNAPESRIVFIGNLDDTVLEFEG